MINAATSPPNDDRQVLAWVPPWRPGAKGAWEIWHFDHDDGQWFHPDASNDSKDPTHWTELPPDPSIRAGLPSVF